MSRSRLDQDLRSTPLPAGLILAGGQSQRMGGRDKPLIELCGKTLVARSAERLASQVGALAISANGDPARHASSGLPVLPDIIPGHAGPLAGIHAGMVWAAALPEPPRHIVSIAADTPFFPLDLTSRLLCATEDDPGRIVIASDEAGPHPVFALWPVPLVNQLRHWMETSQTLSVMAFVRAHAHAIALFPDADDPFFNINTPEDLDEARRRLAGNAA